MGQNRHSPFSLKEEDSDNSVPINFPGFRAQLPGRSRWIYPDTRSSTSRTESDGDDDDESIHALEAPLPEIQSSDPDNSGPLETLEIMIHEQDWLFLKTRPLPTTKDGLNDWTDEWLDAYWEGLRLGITRCVKEGGRLASIDFLTAIRDRDATYDGFCSLYIPLLERGEKLDELRFETIVLWEFQCLWLLLNKAPNQDLEFLKTVKECVCPFKNHQEWDECFYLNEQIRPAKWRPNPGIMGRIKRQAKGNLVLADFIERHREGKPTPIKIDYADHDPRQIHAIFPLALESDMWRYKRIQRSFVMLQRSTYHICNQIGRFRNFAYVYSYLPENRLNSIGPRTECLPVFGVGEIEIQATTPDAKENDCVIRLHNVRYCPWAPCNVISISRCESSGVHWDKSTQMLYQKKNGMREDIAKVEEHFGFSMLEYKPIDSEGNSGETDT